MTDHVFRAFPFNLNRILQLHHTHAHVRGATKGPTSVFSVLRYECNWLLFCYRFVSAAGFIKEKRRQPNACIAKQSNTPHNYCSRCGFTSPNIRCQLGFGFLSRAAVIQSGERRVITYSQLRSARVVTRFFVFRFFFFYWPRIGERRSAISTSWNMINSTKMNELKEMKRKTKQRMEVPVSTIGQSDDQHIISLVHENKETKWYRLVNAHSSLRHTNCGKENSS